MFLLKRAACVCVFTLAVMASMPFFVYRSYWLFTPTLLMWFCLFLFSLIASETSQQGISTCTSTCWPMRASTGSHADTQTNTHTHAEREVASVLSLLYLLFAKDKWAFSISDVNRDTQGWRFHLFCSNLHRQFSMVPMTGSQQSAGRLLPAPFILF